MLLEESLWIKSTLEKHFTARDFPLLNIGSSTAHFREKVQPQIYKNVFFPLLQKKLNVLHTDIKKSDGVDLAGDLNDSHFRAVLKSQNIKSVLCSNLLEHLENPQTICTSILNILEPGGLIIVTVPYCFPFHKDPIDTMFRPSVEKLHDLFPGTRLLTSEIVEDGGSYRQILVSNKRYLAVMVLRYLVPFYKYSEWRLIIKDLLTWNRRFSATCLLMQKIKEEQQKE